MGTYQDLESAFWETVNDLTGNQGQDNLDTIVDTAEGLAETINPATPEVEDSEEAGDELRAKQGTDVGIPVIYGKRRIGGILVYQEVEEDTGKGINELMNLYQCWALCEGTIQSSEIFFDQGAVEVSLADSMYWRSGGGGYADKLIWTNGENGDGTWANGTSYGSDAGIAEPAFSFGPDTENQYQRASGKSWRAGDSGDTHKMKGIACEQISYRHHWQGFKLGGVVSVETFGPGPGVDGEGESTEGVDVWKSGLPKFVFEVIGPVIKDNAGVTKSSKDPAWILYDYLTDQRYGCSIPTDEIDNASFAAASAICVEETTGGVAHSGTPRHECNIILDTTQPTLTNVKRILATCNGRLHWINGLYTMKIDDVYSGSGEFNFLEQHIIGGLSIVGDSVGERLNQVTAKFINPDKKWKSDEVRYPDKNNESSVYTTFLADDNDVKHHKTINVGGITNLNQARYLAKQACLRSRDSLKVSFSTTAEAMNLIVGDVVTITHSTPAWTAKEFIVRSISLNANGTCSLSCIEHNDAIYAWETIGIPAEAANTTLPDITSVTAPTGMTMTLASYQSTVSAGTRISVQLDWTSIGVFTTSFDVQYKKIFTGFVTKQWVLDVDDGPKVIFSAKNHGFPENMPIVFTAEGTVPNGVLIGIVAGTTYYVRPGFPMFGDETNILNGLANNFHVSATSGGPNIDLAFSVLSPDVDGKGHSVVGEGGVWTNVGSTISSSMLLQDFATGTFDFRVRAKNAVGSISAWHTITSQVIVPQLPVPEDVANFDVNINSADANTAVATWDAPSDADLIAGGHIEIRNLMTGSTSWDEAEVLTKVGGSTTSVLLPLMEGDYVAKWIGSDGLEAVEMQESGLGTVFWTNTTDTIDYHPAFAGTKTNLYVADNDGVKLLKFVSEGNWDDFIALDSIDTKIDEVGGTKTDGTYETEPYDLTKILKMRLYTQKIFTSGVSDQSTYMDTWGSVDARNSWDEVVRLAGVTSYIRTTDDDPASGSPTWTTYKKFQVTDVQARGVQLKVQFKSELEGAEQFRMSELALLFDMQAKVLGENNKTDATITYNETFHATPELVVTPKNLVSGDYMTLSGETSNGFNVAFFNSSDASVTRNYNYLAKGVG